MSEQRKRLKDEEWAKKWGARMPSRRDEVLISLRDDHHQAIEDRKRLAERLRRRVRDCERDIPGDQEAAVPIYEMCRCSACDADRALLAEVES